MPHSDRRHESRDPTGQLPDPTVGKKKTKTHPNESPNATLPAGIFLVLRL